MAQRCMRRVHDNSQGAVPMLRSHAEISLSAFPRSKSNAGVPVKSLS